jgi:hypothetical protein
MILKSRKLLKGQTKINLKSSTTANRMTINSDMAFLERRRMHLVFALKETKAPSHRHVEALLGRKVVFQVEVLRLRRKA